MLLSPVLSFTSNPTLIPLIFLISYHFLSDHIPTLIFLSSLFHFHSSLLICFCPTLSYVHATDNHVVPFSSCSHIMCWFNLMFLQSLPPLCSDICFCSGPLLPNLLHLNPVSPLIQTNQIIMFYCISLCSIMFHYVSHFVSLHHYVPTSYLSTPTSSDLWPTSDWLQSLTTIPKL